MSVWVHLRIPVRSRMDLLADKIGAILPLGAAVQLPGLPACPPAASGLGAGPGHDDLGRPVLAQGWGQGAWRPPRTPCVPAHSDPVASVHLLEKTRALPVIEEHRKERGRKGDKQIESGALPPVKAWMVGRQRRFLPFPPEQGRGRSGPRPAPLSPAAPKAELGQESLAPSSTTRPRAVPLLPKGERSGLGHGLRDLGQVGQPLAYLWPVSLLL